MFGLDTDTLPEDYVTNPEVMINFHERTYYDQIKEIDDDFVPYLMPWYGTIVTASALGCLIEVLQKQDPAANSRLTRSRPQPTSGGCRSQTPSGTG